jgi:hypothetical protein
MLLVVIPEAFSLVNLKPEEVSRFIRIRANAMPKRNAENSAAWLLIFPIQQGNSEATA